ncbi:retrovirus-related pol polyprotein from transposon TNT 1-94, partial [Tanacetum coccineum]
GKENGLQILQSIDQGTFELGTTRDTLRTTPEGGVLLGPEMPRTYEDLSDTEKKLYDTDVRATNIVLQGLPKDIYKLINHNIEAKAIWDNVKMLLAGSELTKEDKESQLYDEFERFKMLPGENINEYYVRFHKLVNDMRNIIMTMPNIQLNSKFVNNISQPKMGIRFYAVKPQPKNQNQRYVARRNGAAGNEGHKIELGMPMQDKMLLMQAQENGAVLDEEELLFLAGEQGNTFDADVDNQPTIFMANLSLARSANPQADPSNASILSEIYKEQVAIYEQRAKFELPEREQRMDDQMRMLIQNCNKTEENLKKELHSVKLQLNSTMENNKIIEGTIPLLTYGLVLNKDLTAKLNALHDLNECFRVENAKVKQHYKELYDSIKITRAKTTDQNNSLLSKIENLKAQLKDNSKCVTIPDSKPKVLAPGVKGASAASRSKPRSNTKKDRTLPAKSALKQVEAHSRMNKSNEKQKNHVDSSISYKRTVIKSKSNTLKKLVTNVNFLIIESMCCAFRDFVKQSPAIKCGRVLPIKQWKPTGRLLPLGRQCTLVRSTALKSECCSKHMTGDRSRLRIFVKRFIGTVRFRNDHFGAIMGYEDYVIGDSVISRVYYVEGLEHNPFSVGQFCDSDLELAFRKHTCFVRNLDGVDLIKGSRGTNLYTISVDDIMRSSPICLLSKASMNKSWLWHRRLNHLNFDTLNDLGRKDLVRGLPRLKFEKDHLCSACQLGKIDDYSRFTWVKFLRSKDETPAFIINLLKQLQVSLNKIVRFVRTDNGTKFVNKDLIDYYENVGITYEKTVPRTPQQNDVVERRDHQMPPVPAAPTPAVPTGPSLSISFDHDAPSGSHSPSSSANQSSLVYHGVVTSMSLKRILLPAN